MSNSPADQRKRNFWLTPNGLAALGLIGAVAYFVLSEHRAHFVYALPFLIFLLCPLMHLFMHGDHGGHGGHGGQGGTGSGSEGSRHHHQREQD